MTDPNRPTTTAGTPMLKVSELTHRVELGNDTLTILQGVNLEINRGESVAIVGRSGSGKTTLLGLLVGLDTPRKDPWCWTARWSVT